MIEFMILSLFLVTIVVFVGCLVAAIIKKPIIFRLFETLFWIEMLMLTVWLVFSNVPLQLHHLVPVDNYSYYRLLAEMIGIKLVGILGFLATCYGIYNAWTKKIDFNIHK